MLSPHETLKVAPDATKEEIQQAYRSWTKLVHPDRVEPSLKEFANSLMQDINNAYQALNNRQKTTAAPSHDSIAEYLNYLRESSAVSKNAGQLHFNRPGFSASNRRPSRPFSAWP